MKKKIKLFILYDHPLFGRGLERLLKQETDIEVVGATLRSTMSLEQLRVLRPDVIVVEGDEPSLGPSLWEVLKESRPGRVVSIDLDEDRATIYTSRRVIAEKAEDLVNAVRLGGRPGRGVDRGKP
jgi:DNA-binding NarL/FixJ family response regulator